MSDQIFVRLRGRIQGPFSTEQLQSMSRKGQFSRLHEISRDGTSWSRASGSPDLFPSLMDQPIAAPIPLPATPSSPATAGPPPTNVWYYHQLGATCGPVDLSHLRQMIESHLMVGEDMVWKEGMPEWVTVASIPGLIKPAPVSNPSAGQYASPAQQAYGQQFDPPRVSGLAVASLVLGLLWVFGIGSVLAIIFGSVSLYQISISRGRVTGKGLAVAGLVLGIVFLALQIIGMSMDDHHARFYNLK